jgi:hypothetical protein
VSHIAVQTLPSCPVLQCQCPGVIGCDCIDSERALRAWAYHGWAFPMTPDQRAWCIGQYHLAGDAVDHLSTDQLSLMSDRDLAGATLIAWMDYGRSRGLIVKTRVNPYSKDDDNYA